MRSDSWAKHSVNLKKNVLTNGVTSEAMIETQILTMIGVQFSTN